MRSLRRSREFPWPSLTRAMLAAGIGLMLLGGCSCERPGTRPIVAGREIPLLRVRLGEELAGFDVAVDGPWRLTGPRGEVAAGGQLPWTSVVWQEGRVVFGDLAPEAGPLELTAAQEGTLRVRQTVGGGPRERSYRGVLRIVPTDAAALRVLNVLPMESYLAGVLPNEMKKSWHVEAFKAQAVAARTYALVEQRLHQKYDFDVYDSDRSQVYGGCGTETATAIEAVNATRGVTATYRGPGGKRIIFQTYFHSTCGGATVPSGSVFGGPTPPPLAGVTCSYCRASSRFTWPDVVLTKQEVSEALKRSGYSDLVRLGPIDRVEVAATVGDTGRADTVRIVDSSGVSVLVRAAYWRTLVGPSRVFSTWFTIKTAGDSIILTDGHGWGHGVGLCQWGAEYLAEQGRTGEEILRYYYPTAELVKAY